MKTSNTLNAPKFDDSQNVEVVNDFLNTRFAVSANEYDYVLSFFKKVMHDIDAAEAAVNAIYQVSREANIPVLDIVQSLDGQSGLELEASIAYYLNGIRSPATLVGITNQIKPNFYAARNVRI